ncbi:hypothetical protein NX862_04805 [Rhodobacter sp. KR11]|uniref:hypothetical protein n=1 Tax=Rhodobacter sp. KR11 TaxID=2974588 RepID=UPI002223D55C|nr:hypothetical protein [Rhodobacter sp. KR11]MCW1918065.1 hypothetical protein [Rhodobacter sp. KR11]
MSKSKPHGKDKKKAAQLVLRIEKSERDAFVALCERLDTTAAREIRRFMREMVATHAEAPEAPISEAPATEAPEPEAAPVPETEAVAPAPAAKRRKKTAAAAPSDALPELPPEAPAAPKRQKKPAA